jgi:hypothetical protein
MEGVEDICWLDNKTILSGKDNTLYKLTLKRDNNWKKVADLSSYGITKITRLSSNTDSTKLLIAGDINSSVEDTPVIEPNETDNTDTNEPNTPTTLTEAQVAAIVQKHVEPFNKRQIQTFANAFTDNVVVKRFPNDYMYSGNNTLEENYKEFFKNNKKANIKVLNRMVLKNMVIDDELVTINNMTIRQATLYEVNKDGIKSMTFIRNRKTTSNPESIVNKQLKAYNERSMNEFVKTYASDIKLCTLPDEVTTQGQAALKKDYTPLFKSVTDLNAEIVNRIVLGNKVIDKEKVTANGKTFYAIAIYEVKDGLISKVTFIQ